MKQEFLKNLLLLLRFPISKAGDGVGESKANLYPLDWMVCHAPSD